MIFKSVANQKQSIENSLSLTSKILWHTRRYRSACWNWKTFKPIYTSIDCRLSFIPWRYENWLYSSIKLKLLTSTYLFRFEKHVMYLAVIKKLIFEFFLFLFWLLFDLLGFSYNNHESRCKINFWTENINESQISSFNVISSRTIQSQLDHLHRNLIIFFLKTGDFFSNIQILSVYKQHAEFV